MAHIRMKVSRPGCDVQRPHGRIGRMGAENPPSPLITGVSVGSESKVHKAVFLCPPNKRDTGVNPTIRPYSYTDVLSKK